MKPEEKTVEISAALKKKAEGIFSDMAKSMTDAGEHFSPCCPSEDGHTYYPELRIPETEGIDKKPGDMCYVLAIAEVDEIDKKGMRVKVHKVAYLPADSLEGQDYETED